ncbi:MAG: four helix bundle protein [Oscillospiraceae bacterium]|nr:four helix bundle protein [Oscillospiraceae bacterium]MBQ6243192.1 four helix bundle protein [Bacteroidales bacterium]
MEPKRKDQRPPVYNAARQLYQQFVRSTQKCPINVKRGKIAEIERKIQSIMEDTAFADEQKENAPVRLERIAAALKTMDEVRISIRMVHDLRYITKKGFDALTNKEDNVVRQLKGWQRSSLKNV